MTPTIEFWLGTLKPVSKKAKCSPSETPGLQATLQFVPRFHSHMLLTYWKWTWAVERTPHTSCWNFELDPELVPCAGLDPPQRERVWTFNKTQTENLSKAPSWREVTLPTSLLVFNKCLPTTQGTWRPKSLSVCQTIAEDMFAYFGSVSPIAKEYSHQHPMTGSCREGALASSIAQALSRSVSKSHFSSLAWQMTLA